VSGGGKEGPEELKRVTKHGGSIIGNAVILDSKRGRDQDVKGRK